MATSERLKRRECNGDGDAPRILRVLLEARLAELSVRGENREVDLSAAGAGYDGDCPVIGLLDLIAPVAGERVA